MRMFDSPGSLLPAALTLAAVIGLIWLAGRIVGWGRFTPRPGTARRLSVQEVLAVDTRRRLLLVGCEGRRVLLMTGGAQDVVLGWLPDRPETPP